MPDSLPIAEGTYSYFLNGERTSIIEPWSISENDEGYVVRATRLAPNYDTRIEVVAQCGQQWSGVVGCHLTWHAGRQQRKCEIDVNGTAYSYQIGGESEINETCARPFVLFPLMRIFMTGVFQHLSTQVDYKGCLLIPWIKDPSQPLKLLVPEITKRSLVPVSSDDKRRSYNLIGDQYDDQTLFAFDDKDILRDYRWRQDEGKEWHVKLEDENISRL